MSTEHDERDKTVDKILAAMRDAAPPQGMQARITQRLQQHATAPSDVAFSWRDIFSNSAITGEWWRGAITGAAVVLLVVVGTSLFASHLLRETPDRISMAVNSAPNRDTAPVATPVSEPSTVTRVSETRAQPCAHPEMLRTAGTIPIYTTDSLRTETRFKSDVPSHPAPPLPLTTQERALLRIAQTANPKQLATLTPEEHAKLEAQDAAAFAKFFAPHAPLTVIEENAPANAVAPPEASAEGNPDPISQ